MQGRAKAADKNPDTANEAQIRAAGFCVKSIDGNHGISAIIFTLFKVESRSTRLPEIPRPGQGAVTSGLLRAASE